jgi:hypothetical protein
VQVSAGDPVTAVAENGRWIREGRRGYVTLMGVHGIMESVRNTEIKWAHNMTGLVLPDGTPLVWMLRHGGFKSIEPPDNIMEPDVHACEIDFHGAQVAFEHAEPADYLVELLVDAVEAYVPSGKASAREIKDLGFVFAHSLPPPIAFRRICSRSSAADVA